MRYLLIYCHPDPESFTSAVRDAALQTLENAGHEVRQIDLYEIGFNPVMDRAERAAYNNEGENEAPVAWHLEQLFWAEGVIFFYPTWWYGLPAMLKGWLDRVLIPHQTFTMPTETDPIRGLVKNVRVLGVLTTCGAPWWFSFLIGQPGRKTILRGLRPLFAARCKTFYLAHYLMDTSTSESRAKHLGRVRRKLARL